MDQELKIIGEYGLKNKPEGKKTKLKSACGFEYTNKLQRMFQDQGVSKDLNEQFKQHLYNSNEPLDIDFQIQVRKNTT